MENRNSFGKALALVGLGILAGTIGKSLLDEYLNERVEVAENTDKGCDNYNYNNNYNNHNNHNNNNNNRPNFVRNDVVNQNDPELKKLNNDAEGKVMTDPVSTPYGHTFQRSAILDWLKKHQNCPITKKPLTEKDLVVNYALRDAVFHLINKHKDLKPKENETDRPFCIEETVEEIEKLTKIIEDTSSPVNVNDCRKLEDLCGKAIEFYSQTDDNDTRYKIYLKLIKNLYSRTDVQEAFSKDQKKND